MNVASDSAMTNKAELEYPKWVREFDTLSPESLHALTLAIQGLSSPPKITIVMVGNGSAIGSASERSRTLASIREQIYPHWEVVMPLGNSAPDPDDAQVRSLGVTSFNAALLAASGSYLTFIEAGDVIPAHALATMILSLRKNILPCPLP